MATQQGNTHKLTKSSIEALPYAERDASGRVQQRLYWDSRDKGFGLLVGLNRKTFVVQRAVNGKTVRVTIGRFGPHDYALEEARHVAAAELQKLRQGIDLRATRQAQRLTLAEALQHYEQILRNKKRSASTLVQYRYCMEKYLRDWLDVPLADLTQQMIANKHSQLTRDVNAGKYSGRLNRKPRNRTGETTANRVMKIFGVVFRAAADDTNLLTARPTKKIAWIEVDSRHGPLPDAALPAWYQAINAIPNAMQRAALLTMLFTGMRLQSVLKMQWRDVDLTNKVLHVPEPKGGKKVAFDLPLSDYLVTLLQGCQQQHATYAAGADRCAPYVFASTAGSKGHLCTVPTPQVQGMPSWSAHTLRRTFITKADRLDVSHYAIKALVNHALPRDVTAGYVTMTVERLRAPMQQVADALRTALDGGATVTPIRRVKM